MCSVLPGKSRPTTLLGEEPVRYPHPHFTRTCRITGGNASSKTKFVHKKGKLPVIASFRKIAQHAPVELLSLLSSFREKEFPAAWLRVISIVAIGVPKPVRRSKNPAKQFPGRDKIRLGLRLGELAHRNESDRSRRKKGGVCEKISDGYTFGQGGIKTQASVFPVNCQIGRKWLRCVSVPPW